MIKDTFLITLVAYVCIGLLFRLYFLLLGASRIDPLMKDNSKGVRAILIMGMGDDLVLDLYVSESFSYPAMVERAITEVDSKGMLLCQVDGPVCF